jgi:hypothetical protein
MSGSPCVYKLTCSMTDPRFRGFIIGPGATSVLGHENAYDDLKVIDGMSLEWRTQPLAKHWKPMPVIGPVKSFHDYPCLELIEPVFSRRAVDALGDMLTANGDLLPLETDVGEYFLYVVQTKIDALNVPRSDVRRNHDKQVAARIVYFDFIPSRLAGASIFRIPEQPNYTLVTDRFKERVEQAGLNGFEFAKVWPLPEGADWFMEHGKWQAAQKTAKLAGEAVILRFALCRSEPTKEERDRASAIEASLATQLKVDSLQTPYHGSIEVAEYADGEYRIFCTGPSAEALSTFLEPWLATLEWGGNVTLTKRFGNLYDKKAKEKRVTVRTSS